MVASSYPEPPLPVLPNDDDPGVRSRMSPLRVAADSPILDVFPSYPISPACSVYEPAISPITPSLREDVDYRPLSSLATMDQYLSIAGDLLLGVTGGPGPPPPFQKIQVYTFIVASGKKTHGGVQFEILKNPGIDFYSGFRENSQGGVQLEIPKENVGIDFYSGFRKKSRYILL